MRNVWFTADTHLGHRRIALYARRLFCLDSSERSLVESVPIGTRSEWRASWESVRRMDEHIIGQINSRVEPDDILWHLGDFCYGNARPKKDVAMEYLGRIRCKNVFLIAGNHDCESIRSAFPESCDYREIKVSGKQIVLSHYAQCFWNRSHYGSWMLYGHAHGTAEAWLDESMPGRLSMDVGVDNIAKVFGEYRPVSFDEISALFSSKKGFRVDGHKNSH